MSRAPAHVGNRRTRPTRSGRSRLNTVGTVFRTGIVCFAVWLLLDARQLYQSAATSPLGIRRSVAMAIMHPIARVEEALSLDRLANVADRIIGKTGTPGGSAIGSVTPISATTTPRRVGSGAATGGTTRSATTSTVPANTPKSGLAPIRQPSAAHPLTILDVGDSIGEDLGIGLATSLAGAANVELLRESVGDTGLANLGYYNWLAELRTDIAARHPRAVVVLLGGDDAQSFQAGNEVVQFGTPTWHEIYSRRVAQMMSEATAAGAHVIWVGLPIMGPTSGLRNSDMEKLNAVYATQASQIPGVTYVSSWKLFENAAGQYSTYLTGPGGNLVQARDPDETHIDPPGGTSIIGDYVVKAMEAAWHVRL